MAYVRVVWCYGICFSSTSCGKYNFLMVNRELLRVARIKTTAAYGLFIVLCAMVQCVYNNPDIADNSIGRIFTYCADYKAGGGFLEQCCVRH